VTLYLCPALVDWLLFLTCFAVLYAAGARGFSTAQCAWLGALLQLAYLSASLGAGRRLTPHNAGRWLPVSAALGTGACAAALLVRAFAPLAALIALIGAAAALFFNAFQIHLRAAAPPAGLGRAAGAYTLAWCLGTGAGFLSAGSCYRLGPAVLVALVLAGGGAMTALLLAWRPQAPAAAGAEPDEAGHVAPDIRRRYVGVGWLLIFTVVFVLRPVQTFLPVFGARAGVSPLLTTLPLFLNIVVSGLAARALPDRWTWLYRRGPACALQGATALLLLGLSRRPTPAAAAVALALAGVWCGYAYFCAVYYSSNAGRRSWNIGVNEFLVGAASLAGIFTVERFLTGAAQPAAVLYTVCAAALGLSLLLQFLIAPRPPAAR